MAQKLALLLLGRTRGLIGLPTDSQKLLGGAALLSKQKLLRMPTGCQKDSQRQQDIRKTETQADRQTDRKTDRRQKDFSA